MTNTQAVILGVVQGLTEYLPVSSSAHLVLVPKVLHWDVPEKSAFIFDVLVQLGTLLGVLIYFRAIIWEVVQSVVSGLIKRDPFYDDRARLGWLVALATLPATILGLALKDSIAASFSSPKMACGFLGLTGLMLLLADYKSSARTLMPTRKDALVIGLAQGLALLPGVSRSGSTIATGMMRGISRKNAAQFSFLMSIPVMIGAAIIASRDLVQDKQLVMELAIPLMCGFLSAAVSGYLVIRWFMNYISSQKLMVFAVYCLVVSACGLMFF